MTDIKAILDERKKSHGDFTDHARATQIAKLNRRLEPGWNKLSYIHQEAIDMIDHKIGRILAGDPDFKDHWDDIAGYATLVANRCAQAPATKIDVPSRCSACNRPPRLNAAGYVVCDHRAANCPYVGIKYEPKEAKNA